MLSVRLEGSSFRAPYIFLKDHPSFPASWQSNSGQALTSCKHLLLLPVPRETEGNPKGQHVEKRSSAWQLTWRFAPEMQTFPRLDVRFNLLAPVDVVGGWVPDVGRLKRSRNPKGCPPSFGRPRHIPAALSHATARNACFHLLKPPGKIKYVQ